MIAGWMTVSTIQGASAEQAADQKTEAELARMAAQVQALKADTAVLRGTVATTAERIEARQQFLDALLTGRARGSDLAGLLPRTTRKVSADVAAESGVLAPFAALEQKQLALVDKASATAETRLKDAEALIGRLGLNPGRFVAQSFAAQSSARFTRTGLGGPFIPASDGAAGADPRFAELFVNWQRVEQMEDAMAALPSYVPAKNYTLTSGFGFRYDPFNGRSAQHAGLDLAGAHGEPIYAAANGRVVRAETFGGYGQVIDIDHGRGILTRYGHLSRIKVSVGDRVAMGQVIGAMGSTGRSTGTHLHYEVRVDGQPVNPRPFIEASNYLLAFHQDSVGPEIPSAQ
jgi:murein DD-endopeptidase MepM/ murein hydrolase activator NlpD